MLEAIKLYKNSQYILSINVLNEILNNDTNYITPKFYLMLNYYKLQWWELAEKIGKEILPYYSNDAEKTFVILYIIKYSDYYIKKIKKEFIFKEREKDFKKLKKILKKYDIK